ncbi:hypothetical protein SAMN05428988_3165 [Chitinophaga sp. YR573]|nr:hypothetical protein SAMN05428988_3165 [Chitinophaga sp. YR573]
MFWLLLTLVAIHASRSARKRDEYAYNKKKKDRLKRKFITKHLK